MPQKHEFAIIILAKVSTTYQYLSYNLTWADNYGFFEYDLGIVLELHGFEDHGFEQHGFFKCSK